MQQPWPEWSQDDEVAWELALEADTEALHARAARFGNSYAARRATAFALAARGAEADAVSALTLDDAVDGPFPILLALDLARIRYLAGHPDGAVIALQVGLRGAAHVPPSGRRLISACVRSAPWTWRTALRIVLAGGTPTDRLLGIATVIAARLRRDADNSVRQPAPHHATPTAETGGSQEGPERP